jgi:hypothetical protein
MKKLIFVFLILILASCNTQKKYSDFDYSYSRSGGFAPIYENLLIKGNKAHYSFEGQGKDIKEDFQISNEDLKNIETVISNNNFRTIQEDYKKIYDHISTTINVKNGANSATKSDAAFIIEKDKKRWDEVSSVFQQIIKSNIKIADSKK